MGILKELVLEQWEGHDTEGSVLGHGAFSRGREDDLGEFVEAGEPQSTAPQVGVGDIWGTTSPRRGTRFRPRGTETQGRDGAVGPRGTMPRGEVGICLVRKFLL